MLTSWLDIRLKLSIRNRRGFLLWCPWQFAMKNMADFGQFALMICTQALETPIAVWGKLVRTGTRGSVEVQSA